VAADEVLAYCAASADVLGAFLFGSRGRDVGVDERSDWDVWIVARDDDALARIDERFPYAHGAQVEIASSTPRGPASARRDRLALRMGALPARARRGARRQDGR